MRVGDMVTERDALLESMRPAREEVDVSVNVEPTEELKEIVDVGQAEKVREREGDAPTTMEAVVETVTLDIELREGEDDVDTLLVGLEEREGVRLADGEAVEEVQEEGVRGVERLRVGDFEIEGEGVGE